MNFNLTTERVNRSGRVATETEIHQERFIAVKQGTRISFTVCDGLFERREGEADTRLPPVFSFSFLSAASVDGPKAEGRNYVVVFTGI